MVYGAKIVRCERKRSREKVPPIKGQSVRKLCFKERFRCLWKSSKKLNVENTCRCAKGTAVNVPTDDVIL